MDPTTALFVRYRRHGDLEALGRVFDELAPRLLALALHVCGHAADAEDALQAAFLVAMQKAATFDERQAVGPWLAGVLAGEARNVARREQRRRAEPSAEPEAASGDPVAASERREQVAALRTHIEALPAEQRQVLLLQLQYGLQPAEIAEVLGLPPGAVRMRLHRGLHALRAVMPAGLLATFVTMLPMRGLAAVRASVLREAATVVGAGAGMAFAGVVAGGFSMNKFAAALVLLGAAFAFWSWPDAVVPVGPPGAGGEPSRAAVAEVPAAGDDEVVEPAATDPHVRTAVDTGVGALRVKVRGVQGARVGRETVFTATAGSGSPVVDAVVQVWTGAQEFEGVTARTHAGRTDAQGELLLPSLAPGPWRVAAVLGGARQVASSVAIVAGGAESVVELHVMLGASLRGRVVDARGLPVAGAEVWSGNRLTSTSVPGLHVRCVAHSTADGTFACEVGVHEAFVGARKEGHAASWSHPVASGGDGVITLRLGEAAGAIVAKAVGADGRAPTWATVGVQWREEHLRRGADGELLGPPLPIEARAYQPGCFEAAGLLPGCYEVRIGYPGGSAWTHLQVVAGASTEFSFVVDAGVVVRGQVGNEHGQARAGVYVMLAGPDGHGAGNVVTDAEGWFRFEGVKPGTHTLVAGRGDRTTTPVEVPAVGDVVANLVVREGLVVRGRVVDVRGAGLDNWWVHAEQSHRVFAEQTRGGGTFEVVGLSPQPVRLVVTRRAADPTDAAVAVIVVDAIDPSIPLRIEVPARAMPSASVRGRIVDEKGEPIRSAFVDLSGGDPLPPGDAPDGAFRFDGLEAGHHVLLVGAEPFASRRIAIDVAAHEQRDLGDIVLAAGARLRVHYLRPDGAPWREHPPIPEIVTAEGAPMVAGGGGIDVAVDGGDVVITRLPAGRYLVRGSTDDELLIVPRTVDVRADAPGSVLLSTSLGRRRLLMFGDSQLLPAEKPFHVEISRVDGTVVERRSATTRGERIEFPVTVPIGEWVVEARCEAVLTHRRVLVVTGKLADRLLVEVDPVAAAR